MIKYVVNSDGTVNLLNKENVYAASIMTEYFNIPFNVALDLAENRDEDLKEFKNNWILIKDDSN